MPAYTTPIPQPQTNPTAITPSNKTFTGGDANIDSFMQPFNFAQQTAESGDFRQRFGDWLGALDTPQDVRDRYSNKYGVEGLQEKSLANKEMTDDVVANIKGVKENVASRGSDTIMTQAQTQNVVNTEVESLMGTYQELAQSGAAIDSRLSIAEQNLNEAGQMEMARQQIQMTPFLQEYQDINVRQAREFSGWTIASQMELDRLLANQSAGVTWSNAEAQRANALAQIEANFEGQIKLAEKENEWVNYIGNWGA